MKCLGLRQSWGDANNSGSPDPEPSENFGDSLEDLGDNLPYVNVGTDVLISKVGCGNWNVCVLTETNQLKCMGNNPFGQAGIGSTEDVVGTLSGHIGDNLPYVNLGVGVQVIDIGLGSQHICVLTDDFRVKCFGANILCELGLGNVNSIGRDSSGMGDNLLYLNFGTDVKVASIHSGPKSDHSCVILSEPIDKAQRIKCWGLGSNGRLGYGLFTSEGQSYLYCAGSEVSDMGDNLPLVDLGTESRVKQLALGYQHTCALLIDNVLKCFGVGSLGQLGSGSSSTISSTGDSLPQVPVNAGKKVKYVSVGGEFTCVVYDDDITLKCVGENQYHGQLGQGDKINRGATPSTRLVNVPAIDLGTGSLPIKHVFNGERFTCVIFNDHRVKCFGDNSNGVLGIGSFDDVGVEPNQMGSNLKYTLLFPSPTPSPTKSPTENLLAGDQMILIISLSVGIPIGIILLASCVCISKKIGKIQNETLKYQTLVPNQTHYAAVNIKELAKDDGKKYSAFLSHSKRDVATTATLMSVELSAFLNRGGIRDKPIFLDTENLNDLRLLPSQVGETRVLVALLSKTYLTRPWCLAELYFAIINKIPIVAVNVTGAGYNFEESKYFLETLTPDSLDAKNKGASQVLESIGINVSDLGNKLASVLPNIIAHEYNPETRTNVRSAQLENIFKEIERAGKENRA